MTKITKDSPAVKTNKTNVKTKKLYILAIEASLGTITDVSRRLKVTHGAVSLYLDKHPELKQLLSDKRMSNVEKAEDVLFEHLNKNVDPKIRQDSAKYISSRLGKHKGWTEKTEIEHQGFDLTFNLVEKSVEEIKNSKSNNKSKTERNS